MKVPWVAIFWLVFILALCMVPVVLFFTGNLH